VEGGLVTKEEPQQLLCSCLDMCGCLIVEKEHKDNCTGITLAHPTHIRQCFRYCKRMIVTHCVCVHALLGAVSQVLVLDICS